MASGGRTRASKAGADNNDVDGSEPINIVELVRKLVKLRGGNKSSWLNAIKV